MSSNNESYTIDNWLKIAGLVSEESKKLVTEEEDEDSAEEELDLDTEEDTEDTGEDTEDTGEDTEDADEDADSEEKDDKSEPAIPTDTPTFDTELDAFFTDFETGALTQVESLSLSNVLLEKEIRFDVVKFTDDVARLINNFESLVDYEKIIVDKAESFLVDKHDEEVAQIFIDMLADRHDISLGGTDPEPEVYAMGATGAGE